MRTGRLAPAAPETVAMRCVALLNRDGGTLKTTDLGSLSQHIETTFRAAGHDINVRVLRSAEMNEALVALAADPSVEVVIAGGGDGTISAAAEMAWRADKILGVLPAGTMNLFARSLGVPLVLEEAVVALAHAPVARSDLGLIGDRPFVHQVSIGLQADVVHDRDRMRHPSRLAKILASIRAYLRAIFRRKSFRAVLLVDGQRRRGRYSFVVVSNNVYGDGHMPYAGRLDDGLLGVYTAGRLSPLAGARLAADLARGAWRSNPDLMFEPAREVTVKLTRFIRRRKGLIDGELVRLRSQSQIRILPAALKVLRPQ
ncbi:diacylglycerol/lipid kinase family protein [Pannonibacter tanglangensis]|uniref:Diacylglycerol kinase family lipid kinase n=1 Tax=Pannonibacter tanglangensis TaxID=2750084 RepID=A0ABW9ZL88_9HYPH|nr:diacylglycerol kinase family protein [Pannonibacter sp. XCT-34]NBN65695.1 diacylglycerol kinase family lipid kinase [Pannonibacter sp. XCT-34]